MFRECVGVGVVAAFIALGCLLAVNCSSDGPGAATDAGHKAVEGGHPVPNDGDSVALDYCPITDGEPTYAPTYTAIYCEILSITCALAFCHSGLNFLTISSKGQGYTALVNAPAMGPACGQSGLKLVDPGHPETSLMYLKITNPPCGARMPLLYGDASGMLDALAIEQVRAWIATGAQND